MNTPLVLLCGQANSGKDTVASMLVQNHGAVAIAQADPMKRLGYHVFRFTENQLWGPSEARNAVDTRFAKPEDNEKYLQLLRLNSQNFITSVLPNADDKWKEADYRLIEWGTDLLGKAIAEKGLSPRKMLQTLGTEWGRMVSRNMWADLARDTALKSLGGGLRYDRLKGLYEEKSFMPNMAVIIDGRFRNEIVTVASVGGEAWKVTNPVVSESPGIKGHASEDEQKSIPDHFYNCVILNDRRTGLEPLKAMVDWVYEERVKYRLSSWQGYGWGGDKPRVLTWGPSRSYEVAVANYNEMQARSIK